MPDRRRSALRALVPVALSLLIQLVTTGFALHAATASPFRGARSSLAAYGTIAQARAGARPALAAPLWLVVVAVMLAVLGPALLVVIRRRPGPVLAAISAVAVAGTVLCAAQGFGAPFYVSVLFGVAAAIFRRDRVWAWSCAGAYWLAFALSSLLSGNVLQIGWLVPLTLLSVAALLGPEFGRSRRDARARAVREAEALRAEEAQAERVRIARELHDVLAHSLSQINVQASVGLHLFESQPAKAEDALANIKDTSKQALGEVRQVLGMLRGDEVPLAPEHGLADLAALVDGVRAQGVEAVLRVDVTDAVRLPASVEQAAYRIVQEALTNVIRHAQATRVDIVVVERPALAGAAPETASRLRISVRDNGTGEGTGGGSTATSATSAPSTGRGLLGMRERAELLGGSFSAGPRAGGGFEVVAELPLVSP